MLTVILYGKNDNHGYNYHKRLAISINGIAEMLSAENDEIIFVDDGSPIDFPTAIEAVFDTLTEKTKRHLKVFRTRDRHTSRPRESLARNLGICQSNPENHWVLSTNIDMIFLPINGKDSLTSIVENLPDGFYQLPRFELPENFWERHFDRKDPAKNFAFIREKMGAFSLETIVRRPGFLGFDNPGDFQLMPRKAIVEMGGFHEGMTQGWHVDSNLSKRMTLYFKEDPRSLEKTFMGYHCNHTRQMTVGHKQNASENSWDTFVRDVESPFIPEQAATWGKVECEQISLSAEDLFFPFPMKDRSYDILLDQHRFNTLTYRTEAILPHLIDHFHHLPKEGVIGYIGHNSNLFSHLKEKFPSLIEPSHFPSLEAFYDASTLIVFDFGFEEEGQTISPTHPDYITTRKKLKPIMKSFLQIIRFEKRKKEKKKLVGINVLFTDFHALFHRYLYLYKTTSFTGISMGYAKEKHPFHWNLGKKELKFSLMNLALRFFYSQTDQLRSLAYKTPIVHKLVQHK